MAVCPKCGSQMSKMGMCSNYGCTYVGSSSFDYYRLEESVESELISNLIIMNEIVRKSDIGIEPEFYILGGAALIFHGLIQRTTMDIDTANKLGDNIKELIGEFISDNASEVVVLGRGYKERAVRFMEKELPYINVYLLSQEDLLVSKLISSRDKDIKDLVESSILTKSNIAKAKSIIKLEYNAKVVDKLIKRLDHIIEMKEWG